LAKKDYTSRHSCNWYV